MFHFLAFFITGALYFTATAGFFYAALISRFFGFGVSEIVFLDTLEFILTVSFKTEAFVGVLERTAAAAGVVVVVSTAFDVVVVIFTIFVVVVVIVVVVVVVVATNVVVVVIR